MPPTPKKTPAREPVDSSRPLLWRAVALAGLVLALAATAVLIVHQLGAVSLPGCGKGGGCDKAARSAWSTLPVLGWPVSFLAAGYFTGMVLAYLAGGLRLDGRIRTLAWLGAGVSVLYLVVMLVEKAPCLYCLVVHGGNLVFAIAARPEPTRRLALPVGVAAGLVVLGSLASAEPHFARARRERASREAAASTQKILDATTGPDASDSTPVAGVEASSPGFEGRYRLGPALAKARLVVLTDYQCPDCKTIEQELESLVASEPGVALSIKHFPLSTDCNPDAPGRYHENACWAARAAQAAGILRGRDGFWEMHRWLFARGGGFTDEELNAGLKTMGYAPAEFVAVMTSEETRERVAADVAEGRNLGVQRTPMIFVNGVELKGWDTPGTLTRAVRAVLAMDPAPAGSNADQPRSAAERCVSDWREQPTRMFPPEVLARATGPQDSPVTVVLFGDLLEPNTGEADALIRVFTGGPGENVRYVFCHYPVNLECNPRVPRTIHPLSCHAARLEEAAYLAGGPDWLWKLHNWVIMSRETYSQESAWDAAGTLGLDVATLRIAVEQPAVEETLRAHQDLAASLGITSIPMIFVNGKHVPRWKALNENVLPRIFDEARNTGP